MAEAACQPGSRARRFAARLRGETLPDFAAHMRGRGRGALDDTGRAMLARIAALLAARPAIDTEVNGVRLSQIADLVGEEAFDLLCEADIDWYDAGAGTALPDPHALDARGKDLMERAALCAASARLVELASRIVTQAMALEEAA